MLCLKFDEYYPFGALAFGSWDDSNGLLALILPLVVIDTPDMPPGLFFGIF